MGFVRDVVIHAKKTTFIDAKNVLQQAYEQSFHIHDHLQQARLEAVGMKPELKRPLVAVAMQPAEDFSVTSKLYEMFELFLEHRVRDFTGMDWPTFMSQPHDMAHFILEKCRARCIKESTTAANLAAQWNAEIAKPGQK